MIAKRPDLGTTKDLLALVLLVGICPASAGWAAP